MITASHSPARSGQLGPMPAFARMRTVDERLVRAPWERIFALAANVEAWPTHLRHYRFVRFREGTHGGGTVEMSANRPFGPFNWPTWWMSTMEVQDRGNGAPPSIRYRHIAGITRAMDVEWSFEPVAAGTRVRLVHLWNGPGWPLIGVLAARAVIGPVFVHGIAARTLEGLARVAESRHTSVPLTREQ